MDRSFTPIEDTKSWIQFQQPFPKIFEESSLQLCSEVSTIAKGLKACTAAFSKCRKFEDDVVDAFSSCSKSVADITAKAAALSKNKAALTSVKAKVAKATGSSKRVARAAATDCASFIVLVVQCKFSNFSIEIVEANIT